MKHVSSMLFLIVLGLLLVGGAEAAVTQGIFVNSCRVTPTASLVCGATVNIICNVNDTFAGVGTQITSMTQAAYFNGAVTPVIVPFTLTSGNLTVGTWTATVTVQDVTQNLTGFGALAIQDSNLNVCSNAPAQWTAQAGCQYTNMTGMVGYTSTCSCGYVTTSVCSSNNTLVTTQTPTGCSAVPSAIITVGTCNYCDTSWVPSYSACTVDVNATDPLAGVAVKSYNAAPGDACFNRVGATVDDTTPPADNGQPVVCRLDYELNRGKMAESTGLEQETPWAAQNYTTYLRAVAGDTDVNGVQLKPLAFDFTGGGTESIIVLKLAGAEAVTPTGTLEASLSLPNTVWEGPASVWGFVATSTSTVSGQPGYHYLPSVQAGADAGFAGIYFNVSDSEDYFGAWRYTGSGFSQVYKFSISDLGESASGSGVVCSTGTCYFVTNQQSLHVVDVEGNTQTSVNVNAPALVTETSQSVTPALIGFNGEEPGVVVWLGTSNSSFAPAVFACNVLLSTCARSVINPAGFFVINATNVVASSVAYSAGVGQAKLYMSTIEPNGNDTISRLWGVQLTASSFLSGVPSSLSLAGLQSTTLAANGGRSTCTSDVAAAKCTGQTDGVMVATHWTDQEFALVFTGNPSTLQMQSRLTASVGISLTLFSFGPACGGGNCLVGTAASSPSFYVFSNGGWSSVGGGPPGLNGQFYAVGVPSSSKAYAVFYNASANVHKIWKYTFTSGTWSLVSSVSGLNTTAPLGGAEEMPCNQGICVYYGGPSMQFDGGLGRSSFVISINSATDAVESFSPTGIVGSNNVSQGSIKEYVKMASGERYIIEQWSGSSLGGKARAVLRYAPGSTSSPTIVSSLGGYWTLLGLVDHGDGAVRFMKIPGSPNCVINTTRPSSDVYATGQMTIPGNNTLPVNGTETCTYQVMASSGGAGSVARSITVGKRHAAGAGSNYKGAYSYGVAGMAGGKYYAVYLDQLCPYPGECQDGSVSWAISVDDGTTRLLSLHNATGECTSPSATCRPLQAAGHGAERHVSASGGSVACAAASNTCELADGSNSVNQFRSNLPFDANTLSFVVSTVTGANDVVFDQAANAAASVGDYSAYQCFLFSSGGGFTKISDMYRSESMCPQSLATTDVNGDGISEVVTSQGVFDARTGTVLRAFSGGSATSSVAAVDVSADTYVDYLLITDTVLESIVSKPTYSVSYSKGGFGMGALSCQVIGTQIQASPTLMEMQNPLSALFRGVLRNVGGVQVEERVSSNPLMVFSPSASGTYTVEISMSDVANALVASGQCTVNITLPSSVQFTPVSGAVGVSASCSLDSDGEFNYLDGVGNHGWGVVGTAPLTKDGLTVNFTSPNSAIAHGLACDDQQLKVDVRLKPTVVSVQGSLFVYGDIISVTGVNKGQGLIGGLAVQDGYIGAYGADGVVQQIVPFTVNQFVNVTLIFDRVNASYAVFVNDVQYATVPFATVGAQYGTLRSVSFANYRAQQIAVDYIRTTGNAGQVFKVQTKVESAAAYLQNCVEAGNRDFNSMPAGVFNASTYPNVLQYCTLAFGDTPEIGCGFDELSAVVRTNPKCYFEAFQYCVAQAYPRSLNEEVGVSGTLSGTQTGMDGATACTATLQVSVAGKRIIAPIGNVVWTLIKSNLVAVLVLLLVLIVVAAVGSRRGG